MYVNYNDYELIYLIKEGSIPAKNYMFNKYSLLIKKIYREGYYRQTYQLLDFLQEGLLILEKVIYNYDNDFSYSFFNYFKLCFSRRLSRLNINGEIVLNERRVKYKFVDSIDVKSNSVKKLIEREIENEDELTKRVINECIFENLSIQSFCLKYDLDYTNTYYLFRKIRLKLEKILTN